MSSPREHRPALVVAALLLIAIATLTPRPDQAALVARTPPWCVVCGELGAVDVLLNLLLFAPLGFALRLTGMRPLRAVAISMGVSAAVEMTQIFIPGRDPTLSDLLTNTLGAASGALAAGWIPRLLRPDPRLARWLAVGWAAIWLLQTALGAFVVQPSLPRSWYWGQLAPDLAQFEQFTGKVTSASAGAYPIRIRRLATSAQVRDALLAGEPLSGTATPGDFTPGLAPIVSIFDGQQREIVLLGRWENDLVYRLRTRSFDARLRPPAIRVPDAFTGRDTLVQVVGRYDPTAGTFVASLRDSRHDAERAVALDPQWGWSLLLPFPYAHGPESRWLTALWVAAWMVPLGYWSAAYRRAALGGAAIVLVVGLGLIPLVWGLVPPAVDWLAAAAGLAAGLLAQRPSARSAASP